MFGTTRATSVLRCTATVILAVVLAGCGTTSKVFQRETGVVYKPVEKLVEVEKYVAIPSALLTPCPVTNGKDRSVKEYVRVANTNTPALEQCAKQIEEIRKLQPTK